MDQHIENILRENQIMGKRIKFMVANKIINGVDTKKNIFAPVADTTKGAAYGMATREQAIKIAVEMVNNL